MACGCRIAEEFMSYAGPNDMGFAGTDKHVINEYLFAREWQTEPNSGACTLKLSFVPCEVCPGTTVEIAHTFWEHPTCPTLICYRRTEAVIINEVGSFIDAPTYGNKTMNEIHIEALRKKVDAFAAELETQPVDHVQMSWCY